MKKIFFLLSIFFIQQSFAQDTSSVVVHKDARIDLLVAKQESINTATKKAMPRIVKGYRLMIANTNSRDEAIAAKTKLYTYFPELKAYLLYQAPFFKLKAGNFKTRDEAAKYQKLMSSYFPKGVFIMNDMVELKPEKDEETSDL
jgi:hypothetical protein